MAVNDAFRGVGSRGRVAFPPPEFPNRPLFSDASSCHTPSDRVCACVRVRACVCVNTGSFAKCQQDGEVSEDRQPSTSGEGFVGGCSGASCSRTGREGRRCCWRGGQGGRGKTVTRLC